MLKPSIPPRPPMRRPYPLMDSVARTGRGGLLAGPHVVGQRIVVRRILRGETGPTGGPAMTDVLGVCVSWADGRCVVRREEGDLVELATADIVSGKPVPPRPSSTGVWAQSDADRLALPGWQPVESEPLGDWVLRASGGFSSRGNSVLALGDPGLPLTRRCTGSGSGTPPARCRRVPTCTPAVRRRRCSPAPAGRPTTRPC